VREPSARVTYSQRLRGSPQFHESATTNSCNSTRHARPSPAPQKTSVTTRICMHRRPCLGSVTLSYLPHAELTPIGRYNMKNPRKVRSLYNVNVSISEPDVTLFLRFCCGLIAHRSGYRGSWINPPIAGMRINERTSSYKATPFTPGRLDSSRSTPAVILLLQLPTSFFLTFKILESLLHLQPF